MGIANFALYECDNGCGTRIQHRPTFPGDHPKGWKVAARGPQRPVHVLCPACNARGDAALLADAGPAPKGFSRTRLVPAGPRDGFPWDVCVCGHPTDRHDHGWCEAAGCKCANPSPSGLRKRFMDLDLIPYRLPDENPRGQDRPRWAVQIEYDGVPLGRTHPTRKTAHEALAAILHRLASGRPDGLLFGELLRAAARARIARSRPAGVGSRIRRFLLDHAPEGVLDDLANPEAASDLSDAHATALLKRGIERHREDAKLLQDVLDGKPVDQP